MNIASTIESLYQQYGQLAGITIECQNELVAIGIKNKAAHAEVFLQGAQLTHYQRVNEEPLLFLSDACEYKAGSPLRGGIPICWPWFGDLDKNSAPLTEQYASTDIQQAPAHGFVRNRYWDVDSITQPHDELTIIELSYTTQGEALWPFTTALLYRIEIGQTLSVSLTVKNMDDRPCIFTTALHTYFSVNDIADATIQGFDQAHYWDALDSDEQGRWQEKQQQQDITFAQEVDRIYQGLCSALLKDKHRNTSVKATGSESTVVWNPWVDKSIRLSQFNDNDYQRMVCIETANAANDHIVLAPKAVHTLAVEIA